MKQQQLFDPKTIADRIIKESYVKFARNNEITKRIDSILETTAREFWNEMKNVPKSDITQQFPRILESALDSAFISSRLIQRVRNEYDITLRDFKELLAKHLEPLLPSKEHLKLVLEWIVMLTKTKELERRR